MKDDKEALAGTLRAAVETLTADIAAAVDKMKAELEGRRYEGTDAAELVAVTHAQIQLVKATHALDRLSKGMLATTVHLREHVGIPLTPHELESECGCPECKATLAAHPAN